MNRIRTRLREDHGFTAIEMMVVVVLIGALSLVVTNTLIKGTRSAATATDRSHAINESQRVIERIGNNVRETTQPGSLSCGANCIQVQTASQGLVNYKITGTDLTATVGGAAPHVLLKEARALTHQLANSGRGQLVTLTVERNLPFSTTDQKFVSVSTRVMVRTHRDA